MNWDLWCNQTELTPFSPELHPGLGRWARYREYCGWLVTGWVHAFDQVQRALGTDDTGPVEIWPEESRPDGRVSMRYACGTVLKLDMPEDKGPRMGGIFIGEKGKIEINRNRLASNPPELIQNAPPPADKSEYASVSHEHIRNWVAVHANAGENGCSSDRRAPQHDDLPFDQHLPRIGSQTAVGPRQGRVHRRRGSEQVCDPARAEKATSYLRSESRFTILGCLGTEIRIPDFPCIELPLPPLSLPQKRGGSPFLRRIGAAGQRYGSQ